MPNDSDAAQQRRDAYSNKNVGRGGYTGRDRGGHKQKPPRTKPYKPNLSSGEKLKQLQRRAKRGTLGAFGQKKLAELKGGSKPRPGQVRPGQVKPPQRPGGGPIWVRPPPRPVGPPQGGSPQRQSPTDRYRAANAARGAQPPGAVSGSQGVSNTRANPTSGLPPSQPPPPMPMQPSWLGDNPQLAGSPPPGAGGPGGLQQLTRQPQPQPQPQPMPVPGQPPPGFANKPLAIPPQGAGGILQGQPGQPMPVPGQPPMPGQMQQPPVPGQPPGPMAMVPPGSAWAPPVPPGVPPPPPLPPRMVQAPPVPQPMAQAPPWNPQFPPQVDFRR